MARLLPTLAWCLALLAPISAASQGRHALVVGVNRGSAPDGLLALEHAESDARALAAALVKYGGFPRKQVIVLTGPDATRAGILTAAGALDSAMASASGGDPLFAFFYSGHGLEGRLLAADADLTITDIGSILDQRHARLRVGYFDACFSGQLAAKGIEVTGFNPLDQLPESTLGAEGTVIISSSQGDEYSYEDQDAGGVFTRFFLEAFTRAAPDKVAVELDQMWAYASERTRAFTRSRGRVQTPALRIEVKLERPIYFAFPQPRTARLVFAPETRGCFVVRYADGGMEERINKSSGVKRVAWVYPGAVELEHCAPGPDWQPRPQRFDLQPGAEAMVLPARDGATSPVWPGDAFRRLHLRGPGGPDAVLRTPVDRWTVHVEGAWRFAPNPPRVSQVSALIPTHGIRLGLWLDGPHLGVGASAAFGHIRQSDGPVPFDGTEAAGALGIAAHAVTGLVEWRAESTGWLGWTAVDFHDGDHSRSVYAGVGLAGRVAVPIPGLSSVFAFIRPAIEFRQAFTAVGVLRWRQSPAIDIGVIFGPW